MTWVPGAHKENGMAAARKLLEMSQSECENLSARIVIGDETWINHETPKTKQQNKVWKTEFRRVATNGLK